MDLRWEILAGYMPLFVSGVWMTIQLTLVAVGAGLVLGIAFKKGNTDLQAKMNKGLADIKADGTYDKIYTQYFGAPPAKKAEAPASAASK